MFSQLKWCENVENFHRRPVFPRGGQNRLSYRSSRKKASSSTRGPVYLQQLFLAARVARSHHAHAHTTARHLTSHTRWPFTRLLHGAGSGDHESGTRSSRDERYAARTPHPIARGGEWHAPVHAARARHASARTPCGTAAARSCARCSA